MRQTLTTILEVAGFAMIAVGVAVVYPPAGLVVGGAELLVIGALEGRRR